MTHKRRPYVTAKKWAWLEGAGVRTPGIGLMRGNAICAHLTPAEALALADRLVDMAEALEKGTK